MQYSFTSAANTIQWQYDFSNSYIILIISDFSNPRNNRIATKPKPHGPSLALKHQPS